MLNEGNNLSRVVGFDFPQSQQRSRSQEAEQIISVELRRYLPILLRSIEKWQAGDCLAADVDGRERTSQRMTDCVQVFISSGGKWSAASSTTVPLNNANSLVTDLYLHISLDLFPFIETQFLRPLCTARTASEPGARRDPRFEQKFEAFEMLMDFLHKLSEGGFPESTVN